MQSTTIYSEYHCARCTVRCRTKSHLVAHLIVKHKSFPRRYKFLYQCPTCGDECPQLSVFNKHLLSHSSRKFNCSKCPEMYLHHSSLKRHTLSEHGTTAQIDLQCKLCHEQCKDLLSLVKHSQFHGNPTRSCGQCSLKFYVNSHLSQHVKRVHTVRFAMPANATSNELNYTCAVCGRPFGLRRNYLVQHLKIHYSKPQVCPVCQQLFNSERVFRGHMRQKHPVTRKTIECSICSKSVLRQERYQVHRKYHEKPTLPCPYCPLLFYSTTSLFHHAIIHNSQTTSSSRNPTFGCAICSGTFPKRSLLRRHLNIHNPPTFSCSRCAQKCHIKTTLIRHLKCFH